MTVSRARHFALMCALFAACSTGGPGGDYGQSQQGAQGGPALIDPITCPVMFPDGFGDTCTTLAMSSGTKATAGTFQIIAIDHSSSTAASSVLKEAGQTFRTNRAGHPGGVGIILRLISDTNLTTTDWDMIVDMVDLGYPPSNPASPHVIPIPSGKCESALSTIARGRYNTKLLTTGVDAEARINFSTTADVVLVPERLYAMVFHMEPPGINNVGIAADDQHSDWYPQGQAVSRQERLLSIDANTNAACFSNPPFVADAARDMNFYLTLDDGCVVGATYSCGRGSCFRTIPECDSYGNFNQCHPGYCTTDADCLLDWNHPERGTYPGAVCNNPSGLDYQGLCPAQAETCNGVDDDCNASTDDNLGTTSCGTGICHTTVYSCHTYTDTLTGFTLGEPANCVGQEPPAQTEVCNGLDDSCNGSTDEGLGQTPLCGFGQCQRTVYSCILAPDPNFGHPATCTPDFTKASSELCNGIDDDCDGAVDDVGGPQPGGPFDFAALWQYYYPPPATANITLPNYYPPTFTQPVPSNPTTAQGQCHYGHQICNAVVNSGVASWTKQLSGAGTISCTGPSDTSCAAFGLTCEARPSGGGYGCYQWVNNWVTPVAENYAANNIYVCDGLDNDCDGYTDNVPSTNVAMFRTYWPNSVAGTFPSAQRNTGQCQDGVETCRYGQNNTAAPDQNGAADATAWLVTTAPVLPQNESCNGLDDDCNGTTDDRSALGQQVCGQGVCQTIVDNCSFVTGMGWTQLGANCTSGSYTNLGNTNLLSNEACNGLDDNCDGQTDYDTVAGHPLAVTCHPLCDSYNAAHASSGTVCKYPGGNAIGACRYGLQYCVSATYQSCGTFGAQTEIGPTDESCNSLDDDCDGNTDNIANQTTAIKGSCSPACTAWGANCHAGTGQCRAGTATCSSGALVTAECAATEVGPSSDLCNGYDDDCDNYSDNVPGTSTKISTAMWWSCAGATNATAIAACNARLTTAQAATTLSLGQCHTGTNSCAGGPGAASYSAVNTSPVGASVEMCNGLDDDCDANVDNKPGQLSYTLQQTCASQCSAWASSNAGELNCVAGTGQCRSGTQTCNAGGWGGCPTSGGLAEVGPSVEVCNGFDDNCDGYRDNAKGSTTLPLTTGDVCQNLCDAWTVGAGKASNCVANAGQCRKGTGTCNAVANSGVASWTGCFGEVGPSTEVCNGFDDDCDTYSDTVPGSPGTRLSTASFWSCTGFTGCKNGSATQTVVGQCHIGTLTCSSGSYSLNSASPVGPSSDTCNGYDDDCDGTSDNYGGSSTKLQTATAWNCNGLPGCNASTPTGICKFGTNSCAGAPGSASYSTVTTAPTNAVVETCNALDDDCEGATDNYAGSSTKLQTALGWSCNSISGCIQYSTTNDGTHTTAFGVGACRVGTTSCNGGSYSLTLNAAYNASTDACNGIDDDCDGYTDNVGNQNATLLKTSTFWSCSGFPGCVSGNALQLGYGQCRAGTNTCAGAPGFTTVNQSPVGPSTETCDNSDNDCDGQTDNYGGNGTTTKLSTATFGTTCWNGTYSCYGGSNLCHSGTAVCSGGAYSSLATGATPAVGPSTETCNGYDDDCDGTTDNATSGVSSPRLTTATFWSCAGYAPSPGGGTCLNNVTSRGQCRAGTNQCATAAGGNNSPGTNAYSYVQYGGIGPTAEICDGLDNDCTGVNDDGVMVFNNAIAVGTNGGNLCAAQSTTPGGAGYQVQAWMVNTNGVNKPCQGASGCVVGASNYGNPSGWFGGCVTGYFAQDSSYANGCECADDQFAATNTAPSGCGSTNSDCSAVTTVTCEFGQDLCSVPGATGCAGGFMGTNGGGGTTNGLQNATANINAQSVAYGQIPNQMFRDYYYVKLALPDFGRNLTNTSLLGSSRASKVAPSENINLNLNQSTTPSGLTSPVFFMRVYPYGSFTDGYSTVRTIQTTMGGSAPASISTPGGCSLMSQVLGNGPSQNWYNNTGSGQPAYAASGALAATFDLKHYHWDDSLCPADTGTNAPSWCSTNVTYPNWLVIEVRRTTWAANNTTAPWEAAYGANPGHGPNWGGNNTQVTQNAGPGCAYGSLNDSASCNLNQAISTGAAPTVPTNYYQLVMQYSTGANP